MLFFLALKKGLKERQKISSLILSEEESVFGLDSGINEKFQWWENFRDFLWQIQSKLEMKFF